MLRQYSYLGFALALAVAPFSGCTESDATAGTAPELVACQPLAAVEQPIALGAVRAVGRDSSGTLYVVDQIDAEYRVFQSNGTELMLARQSGSGAGTAADGSEFMSFLFESPVDGTSATLAVSSKAQVVRMAFAATEVPKADFDLTLVAGVELEILDATALAELALRNLPGEILVEYNAVTSNGERLLVTRPRDAWTYTDFRLFYGEGDALAECIVVNVTRSKDGGTTNIRFKLDGEEAVALFPASISGSSSPPNLTLKGDVLALTKLGTGEGVEGLSFTCLEP